MRSNGLIVRKGESVAGVVIAVAAAIAAVVVVASVAASAMLLVGMTNGDDRKVSIASVVDHKNDCHLLLLLLQSLLLVELVNDVSSSILSSF